MWCGLHFRLLNPLHCNRLYSDGSCNGQEWMNQHYFTESNSPEHWRIWHTRDLYALETLRNPVLFWFLVCRMKGIRRNPFSYSVLASTARGPRVISYNYPTFIDFQSNQSRTAEATKFCRHSEMAIAQSPLLGLCHPSITTVATSVILLLATLLFILLSGVHVWKISFLALCWRCNVALNSWSVHGPITVRCCQLEINYNKLYNWRIKKPARCHLLFYCTSYRLNMFRALLCPSSGARDCNVDYHIGRFVL